MNCDAINADNGDYEEIQIKFGYNPIFKNLIGNL